MSDSNDSRSSSDSRAESKDDSIKISKDGSSKKANLKSSNSLSPKKQYDQQAKSHKISHKVTVGGTVSQSPSQEILGYNSLNMKKSPTGVLSSINSKPHEK